MKRFVRPWVLLGLGLVLGLGIGLRLGREASRPGRPETTAQVFQDVMAAIRERYVDSLTDQELYAKAAQGVVATLGDPYSAVLSPGDYARYRGLLTGRGSTVGIALESGLAGLRVRAVAPGSEADRRDVRPGDYLIAINDSATAGLPPSRAARLLEGETDEPITVRIRRPGDSVPIDLTLKPTIGGLPAALAPIRLADSTVYLALGSVARDASEQLRRTLAGARLGPGSRLLLDLRGNAGGPLEEALAVADLFLEPGRRIGAVAKRRGLWATYAARGPNSFPDLDLVILVDRRTASSAEIIAAALRDNGRARLVGERTFGKGLIQTTVPLREGGALRLTTGRWQGPGGRLIAGGIQPDSVVVVPPAEAMVRRVLGREPELVARALDRSAAAVDSGVALDSVRFESAIADRFREAVRPGGITLSRRLVDRHRRLFDLELRRVVAASRGVGPKSPGRASSPIRSSRPAWFRRPPAGPSVLQTASRRHILTNPERWREGRRSAWTCGTSRPSWKSFTRLGLRGQCAAAAATGWPPKTSSTGVT